MKSKHLFVLLSAAGLMLGAQSALAASVAVREMAGIVMNLKHYPSDAQKTELKAIVANKDSTEQERAIAVPWLTKPIDFGKVVQIAAGKIDAIFSDDDPYAPITDASIFKEKLAATITIEHGKGHFSGSDGIVELASARDAVLRYAGLL